MQKEAPPKLSQKLHLLKGGLVILFNSDGRRSAACYFFLNLRFKTLSKTTKDPVLENIVPSRPQQTAQQLVRERNSGGSPSARGDWLFLVLSTPFAAAGD